jgi:hypothetical protein
MVKLFLPAAGAMGAGVVDVATADVLGFGSADDAAVWAKATALNSARKPARRNDFIGVSKILVFAQEKRRIARRVP